MPELPEVQTTVDGLNAKVKNLGIIDVWTSYNSAFHYGKDNVKNPKYFAVFKKKITGNKIKKTERKGKNILIHLSNNTTILAHMKMTGHFMYGEYVFAKNNWAPSGTTGPLHDPFNRHVRLLFSLSNGKHLAFADTRKFAKMFMFDTDKIHKIEDISKLGPDPLSKYFSYKKMLEVLSKKSNGKIKQVLLDQSIISGIGNIYSDEMLWSAKIHPISIVGKIPEDKMRLLYKEMIAVLKKGIDFGGDSTSDYRNIHGLPGKFQHKHNVYRSYGKPCLKKDGGIIAKIKIGGRTGSYCPVHQVLYK